MKYAAYDPYFTLENIEVELDAPRFSTGQTVYGVYTGMEIVLTSVKPGFGLEVAPNGAWMRSAAEWICYYRDVYGHLQYCPESCFVATKEEVKGAPRLVPLCPICGEIVTKSDSFVDGSGMLRHEAC